MATGKYWQYTCGQDDGTPSQGTRWTFGLSSGAPIDDTTRTLLRTRVYARGESTDAGYAPVPPGAREAGSFTGIQPVVLQVHVESIDDSIPLPALWPEGVTNHLPRDPWQYASVAVQPMEWDPPVYSPLVEPPLGDRVPYMWRQCKASVSVEDSHGQRTAAPGAELRCAVAITQGSDDITDAAPYCRWTFWAAFLVEWRDAP